MALIKAKSNEKHQIPEGFVYCKLLDNRFKQNKNVLGANTGGTGSGKSYRDLRGAELWYKYHFKEQFPVDCRNVCFSISEIMKRLNSGEMRKGELLILEEAGANLGSLDFQNKVSKLFTYVLQSFRSMNVGILFNLPYLSMLNKQARLMLHYCFESTGIDPSKNENRCKPFTIQINQTTGKIYRKYPRINVNGSPRVVKRFRFSLPSNELRKNYEAKKKKFLADFTEEFENKLKEMEKKPLKMRLPKDDELDAYKLYLTGNLNQREIAEIKGKDQTTICLWIKYVEKFINSHKNKGNRGGVEGI